MTKDELIVKQQLEIEEYKAAVRDVAECKVHLQRSLFSIGAPLNDNGLQFNKEQLKRLLRLADHIDGLPGGDEETE